MWEHRSPSDRSDQYSLAVVAYLLVAGSLPFIGQDNAAIRRQNLERGPAPAHSLARAFREEAVSKAVSDVLRRGLSRSPDTRYETVSAFAGALALALKGRGTAALSPNIFLSYQRDMSAGWANYFAKELKDHGIATFLDVQRLDQAHQFPPRLTQAIEECDVFVCLLGSTTLRSAWVVEEIRQAHRHGKPMIPIFQESFDPSAVGSDEPAVRELLRFDAVHLFDLRNVHIEHSASDLARLVKNTVERLREA